jgi:hypothetical protein
MTIIGFSGKIRSGKSLEQLRLGLYLVNDRRRQLVTNFRLNIPELKKYAAMKKYGWLAYLCDRNLITVVDATADIVSLLKTPDSIVLLDEAQIFLNANNYRNIPASLLTDLQQSGKSGIDILWAAQVDNHVALQWRQMTQTYIHSAGMSKYDKISKRHKLHWKTYFYFNAEDYWVWNENAKHKASYMRSRFQYAFQTLHGFLSKADKQLFKCYYSFDRLEQQKGNAKLADSKDFCLLPADYYFKQLGTKYFEPIYHWLNYPRQESFQQRRGKLGTPLLQICVLYPPLVEGEVCELVTYKDIDPVARALKKKSMAPSKLQMEMNKYFQFSQRKKRPKPPAQARGYDSAAWRLRRTEVNIIEIIVTLLIYGAFIGSLILLFGLRWVLFLLVVLPLLYLITNSKIFKKP